MSTSIMVLTDGTEIILTGGAALGCMKAHYATRAAMLADWERMTAANLKTVQIKTDGTVTGNYADLTLESETSTLDAAGEIDTVWKIREKTELELVREEIQAMKEGQSAQDNAITAQLETHEGEITALKTDMAALETTIIG